MNKENIFRYKKLNSIFFRFCFIVNCSLLTVNYAFADDCLPYKTNPNVKITVPDSDKTVTAAQLDTRAEHGHVVATLSENYEILVDTVPVSGGLCVVLKQVDADIGYSNFQVQIDSKYAPHSPKYKNVLEHEDKHIKTYLSVIDDYSDDIYEAVLDASNTLTPIFVGDEKSASGALDTMHRQLQSHPEIILLRQKISAEQEIRNKKLD